MVDRPLFRAAPHAPGLASSEDEARARPSRGTWPGSHATARRGRLANSVFAAADDVEDGADDETEEELPGDAESGGEVEAELATPRAPSLPPSQGRRPGLPEAPAELAGWLADGWRLCFESVATVLWDEPLERQRFLREQARSGWSFALDEEAPNFAGQRIIWFAARRSAR